MSDRGLKLCIFLTDPMKKMYGKGEIKPGYYNPNNLFSQIDMISFSNSDIAVDRVQATAGDAKLKIHCLGRPHLFNMLGIIRRIYSLLDRIKPDLLRAYDISLRGALACYFARKLSIPSVISIHNNFDEQRRFDKRPILQLRRLFERYSLSNCDMLICVSEFLKRYVQRYRKDEIQVIYNRVDLDNFAPKKPKEIKNRSVRLLNVARMVSQKNQECLIRALKGLDAELTLIGNGPKQAELKRIAENIGVIDKLKFVFAVPHNRIQDYYRAADIFVHSSHYEGFCIPIIEAMATGLPVVTSDLEVISELTNGCALLCPNNPGDFAAAIKQLIADPQLANKLGEKARNRATIFSSVNLENKEKKCYQELLDKPR